MNDKDEYGPHLPPVGTEFFSLYGACIIWKVVTVEGWKDIESIGEVQGYWKHYNDGRVVPLYSLPGRVIRHMIQLLGRSCQVVGKWFYNIARQGFHNECGSRKQSF